MTIECELMVFLTKSEAAASAAASSSDSYGGDDADEHKNKAAKTVDIKMKKTIGDPLLTTIFHSSSTATDWEEILARGVVVAEKSTMYQDTVAAGFYNKLEKAFLYLGTNVMGTCGSDFYLVGVDAV